MIGMSCSQDRSDPQPAQQLPHRYGVQPLPDTGLIPEPQGMAAGLAAAATEFGRQSVPSDAGFEHKENAGEDLAVVEGLTAGEAEPALGPRGGAAFACAPKVRR